MRPTMPPARPPTMKNRIPGRASRTKIAPSVRYPPAASPHVFRRRDPLRLTAAHGPIFSKIRTGTTRYVAIPQATPANQNLKRIAGWALVSATVGLVLRAIAERFGVIGRIVAGFAGVAWWIATYLVVPVLIFEKIGPWAAVKRSGSLLRKTWGEAAGGYLSLGGIIVLLALPALLAPLLGFLLGGVIGLVVGLGIAVVDWLILGLVGSATQSILVTALYRFATTGKLGFGFPQDLLAARSPSAR